LVVQIDFSVFYIFICVIIVFWVARLALFRPLDRIIEEREEKIESSRKFAESTNADVDKQLAEYEQRISETRSKAFALRQELKGKAGEHEKKIIEEARSQAAVRIDGAQAELDKTTERFRKPLSKEGLTLGESIAELLLRGRS
jgi:F-type H+-transporting ATPase subunit b